MNVPAPPDPLLSPAPAAAAPAPPEPPPAIPPPPAEQLSAAAADAPKIPVPAWAYTLIAVVILPVVVPWLTGGDVRTALATALTALGGKLVVDQHVAKQAAGKVAQTVAAAQTVVLEHRDADLSLGYAQGQVDAQHAAGQEAGAIAERAVDTYRRQEAARRRQRAEGLRDRARARR